MSSPVHYDSNFITAGSSIGEAAAFNEILSWQPIKVIVFNTTTNCIYYWAQPHGAAGETSFKDTGGGVSDITTVTSNGITVVNDTITFGTDVQTTNDVLYWVAFRMYH